MQMRRIALWRLKGRARGAQPAQAEVTRATEGLQRCAGGVQGCGVAATTAAIT